MNENDICPICSEGHIVKEDDKEYCNECGTAFRHPKLYWDCVDAKIVATRMWEKETK